MPDHTTYRIYCRNGAESCETIPRLDLKRANQAAQEHADEHGHLCEVVKVQYTVLGEMWPSPTAIGAAGSAR